MAWKSTLCNYQRACILFFLLFFSAFFSWAQGPADGPGGPILVLTSSANPFSKYTAEVLKAEGFNEFASKDFADVNSATLSNYDVVILGEMQLTTTQVSLLEQWTNAGGTLIAFKPDLQLAPLLGLATTAGSLTDRYLLVNTANGPGTGIVNKTIQFHGTADYYKTGTATVLAMLYTNPSTASIYPAVTSNNVGTNGGKAIAFTYDLMRSIVYTRQGNPAWEGQKRDGTSGPIRSDDLFFGQNEPDWIDLNKVDIPQADEQQRLLGNIIIKGNLHRKPLPRFWFLPRGLKAAIVMTGDDHANNGTEGRFNLHMMQGPNTQLDVDGWKAVRASSYMFPNTPIGSAEALELQNKGFELALHLNTGGGCSNFTEASFEADLTAQLGLFAARYPGLAAPVTSRTHCLVWSDWASAAKVQAQKGIRLDVNYYYWPAAWVQNRSGMFTGSGMPMRFADKDGSLIDCYQVPTQMTDESGIEFTPFVTQLLDKAKGPEGYYGVFCANMHTDSASHIGASSIIAAAQARSIPIISAKQMLTWLDGRNNSSFSNLAWADNQLSFDISAAAGSFGLRAMVPVNSHTGQLSSLTAGGNAVAYSIETIKGIAYAFFDASLNSRYVATYTLDTGAPVISAITATPNTDNTATIAWSTNELTNSAVLYGLSADNLNMTATDNNLVTSHSIILPGLVSGGTYYFRVRSSDAAGNITIAPVNSASALQFTMPEGPCLEDQVVADFSAGTTGANTFISSVEGGAVSLAPLQNEEFSGSILSGVWGQDVFNPNGATVVNNGSLVLSGSHIYSNTIFQPGTAIEFSATFGNGSYQNIGFTTDQAFDQAPWITIGQSNANGILYARTSNDVSVSLGAGLIGTPHRFLLKWNADNFEFYIDGASTPAAIIDWTLPSGMYIQLSDFNSSDGILSVDWLRVTPYVSSGIFNSRIVDAGTVKKWDAITWNSETPAGTALSIAVRTGNTAVPDAGWSPFSTIANSGASVNKVSRYIQYKAELSTSIPAHSPLLTDLTIYCSVGVPAVSMHPANQSVCVGDAARFSTAASGAAPLTVQWQESVNGSTWTNIAGATDTAYTIASALVTANGKQFRAVWTNTQGTVNSNAALLTVQQKPTLTSSTSLTTGSGDAFNYTPTGTAGTSYSWRRTAVNGIQNAGASGSGAVNEILINTTAAPVQVTYVYTLSNNGCSNTVNVLVTVNAPDCDLQSSITANFNSVAISSGRRIWFSSVFKPTNLGSGPVNFKVKNSKISYVLNGQTVTLNVPDATIRYASNVILASTQYINNAWQTQVPLNNGGNAFLTGLSYLVPQNIAGNLKNIKWTADIEIDKPGVGIEWKWTASVYSSLGANANLSVKPVDNLLSILSPIVTLGNAGTVQNYPLTMIAGGMGSGLLNISSVYTASQTLSCLAAAAGTVRGRNAEQALTPSLSTELLREEKVSTGKFDVQVMPNPATTQFSLYVRGDSRLLATVTIKDMLGRELERHEKVSGNTELVIGSTWKTGTYFAEIRQGDEKKVIKIIKIR